LYITYYFQLSSKELGIWTISGYILKLMVILASFIYVGRLRSE
jgi:hypothetical protein